MTAWLDLDLPSLNPGEPRPRAEIYSLNIPYVNIRGRLALLWNGECANVSEIIRVAL